jgi:hypothetical protein
MSNDEYYTPDWFLNLVVELQGEIWLDPYSSPLKRTPAKLHYTKENPYPAPYFLTRTFCNPPYSKPNMPIVVEKFIESYRNGMQHSSLLCNASTSSNWFQEMASNFPFVLLHTRVKFVEYIDGRLKGSSSPRYDNAFFYTGEDKERFVELFGNKGVIVLSTTRIKGEK